MLKIKNMRCCLKNYLDGVKQKNSRLLKKPAVFRVRAKLAIKPFFYNF